MSDELLRLRDVRRECAEKAYELSLEEKEKARILERDYLLKSLETLGIRETETTLKHLESGQIGVFILRKIDWKLKSIHLENMYYWSIGFYGFTAKGELRVNPYPVNIWIKAPEEILKEFEIIGER